MEVEIGYYDDEHGHVNVNCPKGCRDNHHAWAAGQLALKIAEAVAFYKNECARSKAQKTVWKSNDYVTWLDASGYEVMKWEDWDTVTTFQCEIFKTKKGE